MIKKIDHIGIAVKSIDAALPYYEGVLGVKCERIETVESQKVRTAFFEVGGVHLELLEPTAEDSPIAKFLEKKGEGVHHLGFAVDDAGAALARAKEKGVALINESPVPGAGGKQIGFLHPRATFGVLTEFCSGVERSSLEK